MAKAAHIRRKSRKAQTCLAVFLVAVVNLTVQPCVMAMQAMSPVKAPVQTEHCIQHGHEMPAQDMAQDGSCVADAYFLTDIRPLEPDLKKVGYNSAQFAILPTVVAFPRDSVGASAECIEYQFSWQGSPPLRALYCTYLI